MPSGQTLYLMMFVGKYSCTSHVLQYSSSLSYEHSRSLQSILCPGVVTVLICSFFVAALLLIYINLKNGGKIIHIFTNFFRFAISRILCNFAPESIKSSSLLRLTRQPSFGNHGGQYDAEAILFTSKNSKLCNSTFITSSLLCVS